MDIRLAGAGCPTALASATARLAGGLAVVSGPDETARAAFARLLALRRPPTVGSMLWDGREVGRLSPPDRSQLARRVGFAPSRAGLPLHVRVQQGLTYIATLWEMADRTSVEGEIRRWGLQHLRRRSLGGLSPGERQRFVLAASLLMSPDVWILEEPFNALDPSGRVLLRERILAIASDPTRARQVLVSGESPDDELSGLPVDTRLVADEGVVRIRGSSGRR